MFTLKLTIYAKPVRQMVREHGSIATCESKPVSLYLLKQYSIS